MKIWIEYRFMHSDGDKGPFDIWFFDKPNVKLRQNTQYLSIYQNNKWIEDFYLHYIQGLIIEPDETSEIEKRMAEHILTEWKKIGK